MNLDPFSKSSVNHVTKAVTQYAAEFSTRIHAFALEIAKIGFEVSSIRFQSARIEPGDVNDVEVSVEWVAPGSFRLIAKGKNVCFIEFGTGIVANPQGHSLYGKVPEGIVGIGEYGYRQGSSPDGWHYGGTVHYGIPQTMAMWEARKQMTAWLTEIAREVFAL